MATDYTAFESHFTESLLALCEFRLYAYMTRNLPCHRQFMRDLHVLLGENSIFFKNVKCGVRATRMSGEMNTSLGNSFTNLMLYFYIHRFNPYSNAVVEGDDCVGVYVGKTPTTADYARLGLTVKIETPSCLSQASFCGQIFTEEFETIVDPHKIIAKTGWIDAAYIDSKEKKKKELLRCRAMSLLSMYPACPIVTSYGLYLLRATAGYHYFVDKSLSVHEKEHLTTLCANFTLKTKVPSMACRRLMETTFNFSILHQMYLEKYFDGLTTIQPINHPLLTSRASHDQIQYYLQYCFDTPQPALGGQVNQIYVTTNVNKTKEPKIRGTDTTSDASAGTKNESPKTSKPSRPRSTSDPGCRGRSSAGRAGGCFLRGGSRPIDIHLNWLGGLQNKHEQPFHGANHTLLPTKWRGGRDLPP